MSGTPRLALPYLTPGQAQKEVFHNEALQILDTVVAAAIEEPPRVSPPTSPAAGACYLVAPAATDEWAGRDNSLAAYSSGGWRFIMPRDGMIAYVRSSSTWAAYRSGAWELGAVRGSSLVIGGQQVVGGRAGPIGVPSGGPIVDTEARTAISQILTAMRQHGLIET